MGCPEIDRITLGGGFDIQLIENSATTDGYLDSGERMKSEVTGRVLVASEDEQTCYEQFLELATFYSESGLAGNVDAYQPINTNGHKFENLLGPNQYLRVSIGFFPIGTDPNEYAWRGAQDGELSFSISKLEGQLTGNTEQYYKISSRLREVSDAVEEALEPLDPRGLLLDVDQSAYENFLVSSLTSQHNSQNSNPSSSGVLSAEQIRTQYSELSQERLALFEQILTMPEEDLRRFYQQVIRESGVCGRFEQLESAYSIFPLARLMCDPNSQTPFNSDLGDRITAFNQKVETFNLQLQQWSQ